MKFLSYIDNSTRDEIIKEWSLFSKDSYVIDKEQFNKEMNIINSIIRKYTAKSEYKNIKKGLKNISNNLVMDDSYDDIGSLSSVILNGKPVKNNTYFIELINYKFRKCYPGKDYYLYGEQYERGTQTKEGEEFDKLTTAIFKEIENELKDKVTIFKSYEIYGGGDLGDDAYIENALYAKFKPSYCEKDD